MEIRTFETDDTDAVVALWEECGLTRPWNDPRRDIRRKLTVQRDLFLVGEVSEMDRVNETGQTGEMRRVGKVDEKGAAGASCEIDRRIIATVMAGYDGHRGWVNYLAVSPAERGAGHARRLMGEVERLLLGLGCPKLNLQVRADNDRALGFYDALGYTRDAAVSLGRRLIPDAPPPESAAKSPG